MGEGVAESLGGGVGRGRLSHVSGLSVSVMSPAFCQSVWMAIHPVSPPTHVLTLAFHALTWKNFGDSLY